MTRRRSHHQESVLAGLASGRRLIGPVAIARPVSGCRKLLSETRQWGWADGPATTAGTVHAGAVAALAGRGLIVVSETGTAREARLP